MISTGPAFSVRRFFSTPRASTTIVAAFAATAGILGTEILASYAIPELAGWPASLITIAGVVAVVLALSLTASWSRRAPAPPVPGRPGRGDAASWFKRQYNELEQVYHAAPVGLCVLDTDLRYVHINDRLASVNGRSVEDHLGRTIYEVIPNLAEATETWLKRVVSTGAPVTGVELHAPAPVERYPARDWLLNFYPIRLDESNKNRVQHICCTVQEITELKRTQEELRRARIAHERAQRIAHFGHLDRDLIADTVVWSDEVYRILGLTPDSSAGDAAEIIALVHPDDRDRVHNIMEKAIGEQEDFHLEYRIVRPDGEERIVLSSGEIRRNRQGDAIGLTGIIHDVTDRKRAEAALLETQRDLERRVEERTHELIAANKKSQLSENRLRMLTQISPVGIFQADADGYCVYVNDRWTEISGMAYEDALGHGWASAIHPDDIERIVAEWRRAVAQGVPFKSEYRFRRPDGRIHHVYGLATTLHGPQGEVAGYVGAVTDVTEKKIADEQRLQLEAKLQQSQKLESLGSLAGGIAHDFNNLLVTILGNADLIRGTIECGEEAYDYADDIVVAAEHAADLCNQMLAYSGRGNFVIEPVDLGETINDMRELLRVSVTKSENLEFQLARSLPRINADKSQIRQVVLNLVSNAAEAIGEAVGTISVKTGTKAFDQTYLRSTWIDDELEPGTYVYLDVSDTGPGLSDDVMPRIFDPFFSTKFSGRGLGLAAVLGIVRSHNGAIKVYSTPGSGTTFRVLFPCADAEDRLRPARVVSGTDRRNARTILLVDDEAPVVLTVKTMLAKNGYTVLTASNGADAVNTFKDKAQTIDCVLLDLTMPVMGGEEAAKQIKKIRAGVPIVMTSGYEEGRVLERFAEKDADGFIQKPYRADKLLEVIAALFDH